MSTPTTPDVGNVLVVCTGNICRSPFVEALLRRDCEQHWGVGAIEVRSAGTRGLDAWPMEPAAHERLTRQGMSAPDFRSRRLTGEQLRSADLVLTATRAHRAEVVKLQPTVLRRVFTVRELGLVAAAMTSADLPEPSTPRGWLRGVADCAGRHRAGLAGTPGEALDVVDPYGGPGKGYDQMAEQVMELLPRIGWLLTEGAGGGPPG